MQAMSVLLRMIRSGKEQDHKIEKTHGAIGMSPDHAPGPPESPQREAFSRRVCRDLIEMSLKYAPGEAPGGPERMAAILPCPHDECRNLVDVTLTSSCAPEGRRERLQL